METKTPTLRDGRAEHLLTRLLVPGDVVLLMGGMEVPADIEWLEGDVLSVDTAALTGEPLPRRYPSDQHGKLILAGCTIRAGEAYAIVRRTGVNTELGAVAQAAATRARLGAWRTHMSSVFEERTLVVVHAIIACACVDAIIILLVIGLGPAHLFALHPSGTRDGVAVAFDVVLSIIIACVPPALPWALHAIMFAGARRMARDMNCVATSLGRLHDMSAMTVLCADKTGTLTTGEIDVHAGGVWACGEFSKEDVALLAALASSAEREHYHRDAIDSAVMRHVDTVFGHDAAMQLVAEYTKVRAVGFNPIHKRVLVEYVHPRYGAVTVVKGLPHKLLDTSHGGADDATDQWQCEGHTDLSDTIAQVDMDLSRRGCRTLGVAVRVGDGPFRFVGVLPLRDPPRHDTAATIANLTRAGIEVKMITGDHLHIARGAARLVGMGEGMHPGEVLSEDNAARDELVRVANGFAQLLLQDKRELVLILRRRLGHVVGVTGDGVGGAVRHRGG